MTREHEEFVWLHDRFVENDEFAGYIVRTGVEFGYFNVDSASETLFT